MKQNINTNLFLSMRQSDYAFFCLQQAFIQIFQNDVMQQIKNFFYDDDLIRIKREAANNNDDSERIFNRNSEVNLFSFSSF